MTTAFNIVIALGVLMTSLLRSNQLPAPRPALTLYVEDDDHAARVDPSPVAAPDPISPGLRLAIAETLKETLGSFLAIHNQPAPQSVQPLSEVIAEQLACKDDAAEYLRAVTLFESCVRFDGKKLVFAAPTSKNTGKRTRLSAPAWSGQRTIRPVTAAEITKTVLQQFAGMLKNAGASAGTVEKYLRYVSCSLTIARECGVIVQKPKVGRLPKPARKGRTIRDEDFKAFAMATSDVGWRTSSWWRALLLLIGGYGQRIDEASTLEWEGPMIGDVRTGIHWGAECPRACVAAAGITNEFGWLVYLPPKQKDLKPDPLALPLTQLGREVLEEQRRSKFKPTKFVAPVSNNGTYLSNPTRFYGWWWEVMKLAEIPADRQWSPHDMRRNCESAFASQFKSVELAQSLTGHAARDVSSQSYLDFTKDLVELVPQFRLMQLLN